MPGIISIKHDRIKPVHNQHPWIFSGAVEEIVGTPQPGDIVTVMDKNAKFLARGYYNPKSQIVVRLLTWQDEKIDDDWWRRALERAIAARASLDAQAESGLNTYRLVNAENDFLPGLIVDRYGDGLVLQALTLAIDQRKQMLADMLADLRHPVGIYERSDVDVRG
jgi:23S rRNA (cytosine1962-C5)-methyltransferase